MRRLLIIIVAAVAWLVIATQYFDLGQLLRDYAHFTLLGVSGAIFANSTGAGGGVVFIPAFNAMDFAPSQALATSFGIQCFGMTAGSIAWLRYRAQVITHTPQWSHLSEFVLCCAPTSLLGMITVAALDLHTPDHLHQYFSVFSIALGLSLFTTLRWAKLDRNLSPVTADRYALALIGFIGGMITSWLSVGVGELVAVYLLWRRFDVRLAVAVAVVVSAISVWLAGIYLTITDGDIVWPVIMFAAPAAIMGGIVARRLATWINPIHLKVFFAGWIFTVGIVGVFA